MEIPTEWILGAAGAVATAIGALWKLLVKRMDNQTTRVEAKLDKCEERHIERDKETVDISYRLGKLEGTESTTKRIENMLDRVIKEIKDDT